jgi:hypothetical protein
MNRTNVLRVLTVTAALAATLAPAAFAQDAKGAGGDEHPGAGKKGVFVTPKVGGIFPFGGLSPFVTGGLDAGYALDMGLAFGLAADYTAPHKTGTESDPRVTGGTYSWHLTTQQLQVMPFVMYRFTKLGALVPYVAIGPRFYFLKSTVRSNEGTPSFQETTEQSGKIGVGIPIGVEYSLGPGGLVGELLLQYGGLDHTATGNSNTGAASIAVGYRFMF